MQRTHAWAIFVAALLCLSGPMAGARAAEHDAAVRAARSAKTSAVTIRVRGDRQQQPEGLFAPDRPGRDPERMPDLEGMLPPEILRDLRRRQPPVRRPTRTAAGIVLDEEGHVLTAANLVQPGDRAEVEFPDGRTQPAELVGADPGIGVAVLALQDPPAELEPAVLADSDELRVGQSVLAVGSPPDLHLSVAAGVVSALDRRGLDPAPLASLVQTHMALQTGYVGGPLVNLDGEVVGVTVLVGTERLHGPGVAFAVPIGSVLEVLDDLLAGREVARGYLGAYIRTLDPAMAETFGLPDRRGVLVEDVIAGSPADEAGLAAGDIVLEFAGRPTHTAEELRNAVAATRPGTRVNVRIWRDERERTLRVTTGTPEETAADEMDWMGLGVQTLTADLARGLGQEDLTGVLVADVDPAGPAARAGISPGDVIISINREPVPDVETYRERVEQIAEASRALLRIHDAETGRRRFLVVRR